MTKRAQENSLHKRKSRTNTTKEDHGLQYEEDEEVTFPGMISHGNVSKNSISVRDKRLKRK